MFSISAAGFRFRVSIRLEGLKFRIHTFLGLSDRLRRPPYELNFVVPQLSGFGKLSEPGHVMCQVEGMHPLVEVVKVSQQDVHPCLVLADALPVGVRLLSLIASVLIGQYKRSLNSGGERIMRQCDTHPKAVLASRLPVASRHRGAAVAQDEQGQVDRDPEFLLVLVDQLVQLREQFPMPGSQNSRERDALKLRGHDVWHRDRGVVHAVRVIYGRRAQRFVAPDTFRVAGMLAGNPETEDIGH